MQMINKQILFISHLTSINSILTSINSILASINSILKFSSFPAIS